MSNIYQFLTLKIILTFIISIVLAVPAGNVAQADANFDLVDIDSQVIDGKNAKITWRTSSATQGKVVFGTNRDDLKLFIEDSRSARTFHEVELANLSPDREYYYQIVAWNSSGRIYSFIQKFDTKDFKDEKAPIISDVRVGYVSGGTAVVEWETNEKATSQLQYDDKETYKFNAGSGSRVTSHRVILRNLKTDTKYYARVRSRDKDNNFSSYHFVSFTTLTSKKIDNEEFAISELRPSSESDSLITADSITVSFKTNHYAKGKVTVSAAGESSQTINLAYSVDHRATFLDLSPSNSYRIRVEMIDIFNKSKRKEISISTRAEAVLPAAPSDDASPVDVSQSGVNARVVILGTRNSGQGNMSNKVFLDSSSSFVESGAWFPLVDNNNQRIVDSNSEYNSQVTGAVVQRGNNGLRLVIYGPNSGSDLEHVNGYIEFSNAAVIDLGDDSINPLEKGFDNTGVDSYDPGNDEVWVEDNRSYFWLNTTTHNDGYYTSWEVDNSGLFSGGNLNDNGGGSNNGGSGNNGGNGNGNGGVVVLGAEFSRYTRATALYRVIGTPDVYAIMNGQAHFISSPTSFREYGYRWEDVKPITKEELDAKHPRARLLKHPDHPAIYFLYQRPEDQWLKIILNSPTVFVSYPENYWGNVIRVNQYDIDSYPFVQLIKTKDSPAVYNLQNSSTRHFVSAEVFKEKGFNKHEVAEVSRIHMDSYLVGESLK